jgi:hypothetical protein
MNKGLDASMVGLAMAQWRIRKNRQRNTKEDREKKTKNKGKRKIKPQKRRQSGS